jgi:hypothetical protein
MAINVPYTKLQLLIAGMSASSKMNALGEEVLDDLANKLNAISSGDPAEFNKEVAASNGITVLDLINSPNMALMQEEYRGHCLYKAVNILKTLGFTEEEAWAIMLADKIEAL